MAKAEEPKSSIISQLMNKSIAPEANLIILGKSRKVTLRAQRDGKEGAIEGISKNSSKDPQ